MRHLWHFSTFHTCFQVFPPRSGWGIILSAGGFLAGVQATPNASRVAPVGTRSSGAGGNKAVHVRRGRFALLLFSGLRGVFSFRAWKLHHSVLFLGLEVVLGGVSQSRCAFFFSLCDFVFCFFVFYGAVRKQRGLTSCPKVCVKICRS